jgi:hypothetical protein
MEDKVRILFVIISLFVLATSPATAADITPRLDAAKSFYQKGDLAKAAHELEAALSDIQDRLGRTLSALMPAPLAGWQADEAEYEALGGSSGGGLSVTRAYSKETGTLNASIILDNPAVNAALEPQQSVKTVKVGAESAILRWDNTARSGDISIVLGKRVLLQIEGDDLSNSDALIEAAKGFDFAAIRKAVGLN